MFNFGNISFVHPALLWLLLLIPILSVWYYYNQRDRFPTLNMPNLNALGEEGSLRGQLSITLPILRALTVMTFIVALARPQATLKQQDIKSEGIDIILSMDISSSMLAQDFKPDRLEASKSVADEFVDRRPYDRIGLVIFSGEAFTQCPATTDHKVVKELLSGLQCGSLLEDGTAIGMGLATAVNRLKDSKSKSKVVILLTDGVNNSGYIDPKTAAEIAKQYKVKVYTIGVGTRGVATVPSYNINGQMFPQLMRVEIDEELLEEIATMTGGKYFRATDESSLFAIYQEIDRLEKTEIEVTTIKRYSEEYFRWIALGLIFLIMELVMRYTVFRTIP